MKATISVAGAELPDEESCGRLQDRVLTQPTVLRLQPADLLLLLGDPGRLAAVNLGLGDPASAPPRYLVGYPARCYSTSRTARPSARGSTFFGMTCILPTQKECGIKPARPREEHRLPLDAIRRWGSVDAERDSAPVTSAGPGSS